MLILLALLFLGIGGVLGIGAKLGLEAAGIKESIPGRVVQIVLQVTFIAYFFNVYLKKFEGRSLGDEYPGNGWLKKVSVGLGIGAGLIAIQVGILAASGHYSVISAEASGEVIKYMILMLMVGFLEELVTRAVIFRLVEKWAGSLVALIVVVLEGALTHATNPNSTLWSSTAVGLEFGLLMTLVYMLTRNLWTVSAIHFAWNFTMGGIFGINVSGTEAQSILQADISGPAWLTGGEFGIEAGTPAVVLTILISIYLIKQLNDRNGFRKRME